MFKWKEDFQLNENWLPESLDEWTPMLRRDLLHYWERERDPGTGNRWAALSPKYKSWKIKHYGSLPKLILSGALLGGVTIRRDGNRILAETLDYGLYHQTGTSKMPARPYLGIPPVALNQLTRISARRILVNKRNNS